VAGGSGGIPKVLLLALCGGQPLFNNTPPLPAVMWYALGQSSSLVRAANASCIRDLQGAINPSFGIRQAQLRHGRVLRIAASEPCCAVCLCSAVIKACLVSDPMMPDAVRALWPSRKSPMDIEGGAGAAGSPR
jgi:hypothetical protein